MLDVPYVVEQDVISRFFGHIPDPSITKLNSIRNEFFVINPEIRADFNQEKIKEWLKLWLGFSNRCRNGTQLLSTPYIPCFTWHSKNIFTDLVISPITVSGHSFKIETMMIAYHYAFRLYNQASFYLSEIYDNEKTHVQVCWVGSSFVCGDNTSTFDNFMDMSPNTHVTILKLLIRSFCVMKLFVFDNELEPTKCMIPTMGRSMWADYHFFSSLPLISAQKMLTFMVLLQHDKERSIRFATRQVLFTGQLWLISRLANATFMSKVLMNAAPVRKPDQVSDLNNKSDDHNAMLRKKQENEESDNENFAEQFKLHLVLAVYLMVEVLLMDFNADIRTKQYATIFASLLRKGLDYLSTTKKENDWHWMDLYFHKYLMKKIPELVKKCQVLEAFVSPIDIIPQPTEKTIKWSNILDQTTIDERPFDFFDCIMHFKTNAYNAKFAHPKYYVAIYCKEMYELLQLSKNKS